VGVDLGRGQALVAQKFLNNTQVGPALEEVGGVGVAQGVGVNMTLADPGGQNSSHVARCQALAPPIKEHCGTWRLGRHQRCSAA